MQTIALEELAQPGRARAPARPPRGRRRRRSRPGPARPPSRTNAAASSLDGQLAADLLLVAVDLRPQDAPRSARRSARRRPARAPASTISGSERPAELAEVGLRGELDSLARRAPRGRGGSSRGSSSEIVPLKSRMTARGRQERGGRRSPERESLGCGAETELAIAEDADTRRGARPGARSCSDPDRRGLGARGRPDEPQLPRRRGRPLLRRPALERRGRACSRSTATTSTRTRSRRPRPGSARPSSPTCPSTAPW